MSACYAAGPERAGAAANLHRHHDGSILRLLRGKTCHDTRALQQGIGFVTHRSHSGRPPACVGPSRQDRGLCPQGGAIPTRALACSHFQRARARFYVLPLPAPKASVECGCRRVLAGAPHSCSDTRLSPRLACAYVSTPSQLPTHSSPLRMFCVYAPFLPVPSHRRIVQVTSERGIPLAMSVGSDGNWLAVGTSRGYVIVYGACAGEGRPGAWRGKRLEAGGERREGALPVQAKCPSLN